MELQQLHYFKTLCEYKNFAKAAASLYIAPSTLTNAIKKLESELNTVLIIRNNHTFTLTHSGELLLDCAEKVQENVSAFQAALVPASSDNKPLRLGLAIPLCSMRLLENINLFGEEHSSARISITRHTGGTICKYANGNDIDLGIVLSRHLNIRDLEYVPFENMEYGVFMPEDHAWAGLERITPDMFRSHQENIINSKGGSKYAFGKYFNRFGIEFKEGNFTNMYIENTLHFIALHMGIAILPLDSASDTPGVTSIPFDPPLIVEHLFVWNKLFPPRDGVQLLIDYLYENRFCESLQGRNAT
jgi:DNA-binding transcriptional LysR family regulator